MDEERKKQHELAYILSQEICWLCNEDLEEVAKAVLSSRSKIIIILQGGDN
jgi:hypothetical protein